MSHSGYRGSGSSGDRPFRRGRGRRGHFNGPRPRFEDLSAALHEEFPSDPEIVEKVLAEHRNTPLETLRRLVKDQKYAYVPQAKDEFREMREEYRQYLLGFQVILCPANCIGKECMYYHKVPDSAIRRKPKRLSNGVWKYLPVTCLEPGCSEEFCGFAHCSTEVLYHPMHYKTKPCDYKLTASETCTKYEYHCPFIHPEIDGDGLQGLPYNVNNPQEPMPQFLTLDDQREYNERMRHFSDTYVSLAGSRKNKVAAVSADVTDNNAAFVREMYKVIPCTLIGCKRDEKCTYYHSTLERRRANDTNYSQQPCGYCYDEVGKKFLDPISCPQGDACDYSHTENEVFFHRAIFRRKPCLNFLQLSSCPHPYCPFLHERGGNAKLPSPIVAEAPVPVPVAAQEVLRQPDMSGAFAAKIEEVKLKNDHLRQLVSAAESELQRLEAASKCSTCQHNDHIYALMCGHTLCAACVEQGLKVKLYFCKKCNLPSKGVVRFAE